MNGTDTGVHTAFFDGGEIGFSHFHAFDRFNEIRQYRVIRRRLLRQRMLRRYGHVGNPKQGIGAGGIDRQWLAVVNHGKVNFNPFGAANPIALHGFDLLRPAVELIKIV